jgi:hypothetical protein
VECNIGSLDPEDNSLWRMTKQVMRFPTPSPPIVTQGVITLSYSEKAESPAESLVAQCHLTTVSSFLALIEMCDVALGPTSRHQHANPS